MDKNQTELFEIAKESSKFAYSPYSGYNVGAALQTKCGKIFTGCNIENASYSLSCCAERTAFFKAVNDGKRNLKAIAVVAGFEDGRDFDKISTPCGSCRQVMREFCDPGSFVVLFAPLSRPEEITELLLDELLPHSFGPDDL